MLSDKKYRSRCEGKDIILHRLRRNKGRQNLLECKDKKSLSPVKACTAMKGQFFKVRNNS